MSSRKRTAPSTAQEQRRPAPAWRRSPPARTRLAATRLREHTPTRLAAAACLTLACLAPGAAASAGASGPASAPRARIARTLSVNDTGYLHLANPSSASSTLIEEGHATGTLPGTVRARLAVGTSTVRVAFTIYLRNGVIVGHGTASLNPGKGEFASFGGSIAVSHGSGHYAHASGSGRVYGTINRNTDNAVVQVQGQLRL